MIDKFSVDTNVLIYLVQPEQQVKYKKAKEIYHFLAHQRTLLSLQVLNEFYYVVTRKKILAPKDATMLIAEWMNIFEIVTPNAQTLLQGIELQSEQSLSFWDALLVAVAQQNQVRYFFSEDGQHNQKISKLHIINPFLIEDFEIFFGENINYKEIMT